MSTPFDDLKLSSLTLESQEDAQLRLGPVRSSLQREMRAGTVSDRRKKEERRAVIRFQEPRRQSDRRGKKTWGSTGDP